MGALAPLWILPLLTLAAPTGGEVQRRDVSEADAVAIRPLAWTGTARIHDGESVIDIGVRTRVVPFASARSESWLLSEGSSSTRTMIIEPTGGWLERGGKREPMPEAMLRHERQQYALYGLLQVVIRGLPHTRGAADARIPMHAPNAPTTWFSISEEGRVVKAENQVDDPEGKGTKIDQVFLFSGAIEDKGLSWPRVIEIQQGGKPYFTLTIDSFEVE